MTDQPTIEIRIRYFAMLRELLGRSEETLSVPAGTAASAIYPMVTGGQPRLAAMQRSMMLMVNEEYVRGEHSLADGDELAFIPPVSGGEHRPAEAVRHHRCGARPAPGRIPGRGR